LSAAAVFAAALMALDPMANASYEARPLFRFDDPQIIESSGIAPSTTNEHVVFTHNDSGDTARFFAVDDRGCTLTRYAVTGAAATDWEDMARDISDAGHPVLWFADIGDNAFNRAFVTVYRVDEPIVLAPTTDGPCPVPVEAAVPGTRFDLAYPDGAHDAEAIAAHPTTGQLFIVTKAERPTDTTGVYAAPLSLQHDAVNTMTNVATITLPVRLDVADNAADGIPFGVLVGSQLVTSADISSDATHVVVRTYAKSYEWSVVGGDIAAAFGSAPTEISLPAEPQGEAIAYTANGNGLYITSEDTLRTRPPVYLLEPTS
jgi:hypothetical protein